MLMANSVEGRVPFLDHRVIEFANTLPPNFKLRGLRENAPDVATETALSARAPS